MFIYGSAKKPDEKNVKSRSNLKQNWVKQNATELVQTSYIQRMN